MTDQARLAEIKALEPDDYAALHALADAAVPNWTPWIANAHEDWKSPQTHVEFETRDGDRKAVARFRSGDLAFWCTIGKAEYEWANAQFIAAASPYTVKKLLDEIARLITALENAKREARAEALHLTDEERKVYADLKLWAGCYREKPMGYDMFAALKIIDRLTQPSPAELPAPDERRLVTREGLIELLARIEDGPYIGAVGVADAILAADLGFKTVSEEEIARELSGYFGPGWDQMYQNKREWIDDRGSRQPDVNGPFRDDCTEAARAILKLLKGEK